MGNGEEQGHDLGAEQAAFKLVLDQYNRHLGFIVDMSQKCIVMVFGYAALYYSLHKDADAPAPGKLNQILILVISLLAIGLVVWMQKKYFLRCQNCVAYLNDHAAAAAPADLPSLGVLNDEHKRIIIMWGSAFLAIFGGVLISIFAQQKVIDVWHS